MKFRSLLLSCLTCLGLSSVLAVPTESKPEAWISPQARTVIERARAAYAALEGWTQSSVTEARQYSHGQDRPYVWQVEERYLKGPGPTPFYAVNFHYEIYTRPPKGGPDAPRFVVVQNGDSEHSLRRWANGTAHREASPPTADARPNLLRNLEGTLGSAQHVRYLGCDLVDGKACEVVEATTVRESPPESPPVIATNRFYVDAQGFIVKRAAAQDAFEKRAGSPEDATARPSIATWEVERVTRYDAKASLKPADFSREVFEREASALLKPGEAMPATVEKLYRPGESLPDLGFIAWDDRKPFRIADFKGRVVVVETWASWCHFCKEAFPFYEKMRQKLEAQDVVFVAVSFDQKVADYEKWMNANAAKYGFKFGLVDAPDPKAAMNQFRGSLPAFYVLGRDGKVVGSYIGYGYGAGGEDPRLLAALRDAGIKL